ncbi:hypothetical protein ACTXO9_07265 [Brachybacterium tyrofermentans]|uniref:hypothetical protein n=1 Tax=Brachybacterium tyrofermentans TaxID=47848 RepID=UPI003FD68C1E
MATDGDAQGLGFSTPAGTDFISEGDNAISANARNVTRLFDTYRMNRGTMPLNADVNTYHTVTHSGLWHINSVAGAESVVGLPADAAGQQGEFLVLQGSATGVQIFFPYGYYGGPFAYVRRLLNASTKEYSPWEEWITGTPIVAAVAHAIRQTQFLHAMGGPIDTGGLGAVAIRCDHGFTAFRDKVLPAVKARGIKVAQAYNPRNWHYPENEGVTAADLNGWVAAGDVEIMNHSANHLGADTAPALRDQIVTALAEIEAQVPAAAGKVWGFAPPGVSSGNYGGFNDGRTPEGWDTFAGRLILEHHAIGTGYLAGTSRRILDGTPRDGLGHITIDGQSLASLKAAVDEVIAARQGLQLMLHPSQLDATGKLSTAQFTELLDYIVAKRTAGELVTLSPYQLLVADATRPPAPAPAWSEVTSKPSTFPPATHTHADLVARLAVLEYDSGERDVTSLLPGVVSGALYVQRVGSTVWLDFRDLVCTDPENSWHSWSNVLPPGLRPNRSWEYLPLTGQSTTYTVGPVRVGAAGDLVVYGVTGQKIMRGLISFPTPDAPPSSPPGSPA